MGWPELTITARTHPNVASRFYSSISTINSGWLLLIGEIQLIPWAGWFRVFGVWSQIRVITGMTGTGQCHPGKGKNRIHPRVKTVPAHALKRYVVPSQG